MPHQLLTALQLLKALQRVERSAGSAVSE